MSLPIHAVRRPVTTFMALLCVMVIGAIAIPRLPLAFLPTVDAPFIGVQVPYPNSSPTQIEKEIVKPMEEVLSTLSGVRKMRATATADGAEIELEFSWGQDLDVVRMQVSEKIEQVKPDLPTGATEVQIFSFNTSDIPIIQGRIAAKGVDLASNYELLETRVVNRIRRVAGVARVNLGGVAPREIEINLELDKIKAHGVDVGELIERLQNASSNMVLGQVTDSGLRYAARALGAFASVDEIRGIIINKQGLRLGDVATITYQEPPSTIGRHLDGETAVAVDIFKESTANTVDVVRAVEKVIHEDINSDPLLKGVQLFVFQDQAKAILDGLEGLTTAGWIGGLLAFVVLYIFLRRFDSTAIVSLSIPFSIIAACGVLYFMGKNLNVLSMMGLMLGVGMLVDNAIVVLESIDRRRREVKNPVQAAQEGAHDVSMAVAASTLTSVIVFLPLIVGGTTELTVWLGEVGIAITIALVCSLFSSLTLIPLMSAKLLGKRDPVQPKGIAWLEDRYVRVLAWTLRRKGWTTAIVIIGLVAGLIPFFLGMVRTGIFSARVNDRMFLDYEFQDFSYLSDSARAVTAVEEALRVYQEDLGIRSIYSFFEENRAGTVLLMANQDLDDDGVKELRGRIREKLPTLPGVRVIFDEDTESGGDSTFFSVKFFGQDSGVLAKLAEEAERRLATGPGVQDITSGGSRNSREIQVHIDRDKAMQYGLTAEDVSRLFNFTLGGTRLRRFNAGDREVDTWLELRLEDRENVEDLKQLPVGGRDGQPILLSDVATFDIVPRAHEIVRENRKVRTVVSATYEGKEWDASRKQIAGLMDAFDLPPGYTWSWDDRILEQGEENSQMGVNFLLALLLVYIVMASLFESLAQPFAILFSIPFALPGAAWTLALTRTPMNLMAQIGLLMLMGIVVNNGIVLLDHMNQLRKAGVPHDEAILRTGRDRLRAILMTAVTTIVGLAPMAIGSTGVGNLYYFPLARTIMGGLISSTFLTLLVLPFINLGVEGAARWMRRLWSASAPAPASPAPAELPAPVPAQG